eukprot:TRINITY_DN428_c0_g1_i5.p1 TRINITY_DN428_c0_g1~~TRINITY_DN428_c0_g1_i5.p1  ORF type:complete len:63 (-),score=1.42 TRINITY_DN428_c0_g1_i5:601-789(-)
MRKLTLNPSSGTTGYRNSWDNKLEYYAGSNKMIHGFYSKHDNHREDRLYAFYTATASVYLYT